MNSANPTEVAKKIIATLDKPQKFLKSESFEMKRATDDASIIEKLSVRLRDGILTNSIKDFIDKRNKEEMLCYKAINTEIPLKEGLNPHRKPDPYENYFVTKVEEKNLGHIEDLDDLLKNDDDGLLNLFKLKEIAHIGPKGSGKTISQNVWLYRNHEQFENNKIFWVRLDASKLINLWEKIDLLNNNDLITTESYMLGQLVYVFCKHFQEEFPDYSQLFGGIANKLSQSPENNISHIDLTKSQSRSYGSDAVKFQKLAKDNNINTVIDYLKRLESIVAQAEHTYKDAGKNRLSSIEKPNTFASYLVDDVFTDAQKGRTDNFIEWITIGKILRNFILENDYYILYIIDGIDNINFYLEKKEDRIKKLFEFLYEFPLKISNSNIKQNELLLMTLRNNTFEELRLKYSRAYRQGVTEWKNVDNFFKIYQTTEGLAKPIRSKRFGSFLTNSKYEKCYMYKVFEAIKNHKPALDEKIWNASFRCMLFNGINLAKYITFRYYLLGEREDFNIEKQIEAFGDINLFLNGELFIWEKKKLPVGNTGNDCFNLFGYVNKIEGMPLHLIYTHLLQLIDDNGIKYSRIEIIMISFGVIDGDCKYCIDRLVSSGMIEHVYSNDPDEMQYYRTSKGKFFLSKFYNDIHYLYHASLDTLLPAKLVDSLKISPNNISHYDENKNRNYPPYCIITGMLFLQYLNIQNKNILNNKLKQKLKKQGIDSSKFNLPIKKDELLKSIELMVNKCQKDPNFSKILNEWLKTQGY